MSDKTKKPKKPEPDYFSDSGDTEEPKLAVYYFPNANDDDDAQHAAEVAIGEFWKAQYQAGEWIRLTRIADWIAARDQNGNRVSRDESLIDAAALAVYDKLSTAIAAGFFQSMILISLQWPGEIPSEITIEQFNEAKRSFEPELFTATYLQHMAIKNSDCAAWLSREGYSLPPWIKSVTHAILPRRHSAGAPAEVPMTNANSYLEEVVAAHNLEGFKDVFWNLGQIVAWVETRSPFPVDALSDSTKDLAGRDHSMPSGLPHFAAEVADSCADENGLARTKSPFQSVNDVRRAVLRSFQSGLLAASGQRRGSFDREPITPLEWADLTMDDSLAGEMTVRHRDGFVEAWTSVRVKRDDVISAFPMPVAQPEDVRIVVNRKGRAPTYDWSDAMEFAVKQLENRGDFLDAQNAIPGWRSQADLMRLVITYMAKFNDGNEPAESNVRKHLTTTIAEWRSRLK